MSTCNTCYSCGRTVVKTFRCPYCGRFFCERCFYRHMAWERRHESISVSSDLWRLRRRRRSS